MIGTWSPLSDNEVGGGVGGEEEESERGMGGRERLVRQG